jgi:uncharacterized protein
LREKSAFLDTNVLLRHIMGDEPRHSALASQLFSKIESGEVTVRTAETVIMETVFTLERTYKVPKARIRETLLALLELPGLRLSGKVAIREALDIYVDFNLSFIDAYHVAMMPRWGLDAIISFDQGLDRVPGIQRLEP